MVTNLPAGWTRINHSGHLGTIKFVGNVHNSTGTWLGIEWDDPQRGKHDGIKDGRRYFTCSVPGAGSFIRPLSTINYGVSFLHALLTKYIEAPHGVQTLETVRLGSSNGVIEVEAVGLDKIRGKLARLERLREISLDLENVATVDLPGEIKKKCPNVRGLDLTKNLIPGWDTIASIACELIHLERLAVNQNRFLPPSDNTLMSSAFSNLSELQLNGTLTTWQQLTQSLLPYMPKIELVEMGYNRLTRLSGGQTGPGTKLSPPIIQTLNLDGNDLSDWADICRSINPYPTLTRLILVSNKINDIKNYQSSYGISQLKYLALSNNGINSWSSIDALVAQCPGLESLSLTGTPLIEGQNCRAFVIARMGSLTAFNGTTITPKERSDCEIFYLSHIIQHGPQSDEERSREHPRYRELCLKHGEPDTIAAPADRRQDTLGNRLIVLEIHRISTALANGDPITSVNASESAVIRVLPSMTLRTLRLKILRTFGISAKKSAGLYLQMDDGVVATLQTEQDMYDLTWWGLIDGANIFVFIGK